MGVVRHPFDPAPHAVAPYPGLDARKPGTSVLQANGLSEPDHALIRALRPEAFVPYVVTGGSGLFSIAIYAAITGVPIACGLVLGMWAHELGHRAMLRRLGLAVSPIVFVPFVGAVQRMRERPADVVDAARMALAGPLCGLLFAIACKLGYAASHQPELQLLGTAHALLTLLDLLPVGPFDGRRIVEAFGRERRIAAGYSALLCAALCLCAL